MRTFLRTLSACGLVLAGSAFLTVTASGVASAAWPEKPVKVIIPWSPGGITDTTGRLLAQEYSDLLGQQFVVENRPGASGNIGAELVANADADGYTLLLTNPGAYVTNHFLYSNLNYKPSDFDVIIAVAKFPNALMVHKDVPANSAEEFIAYAKANPGKLSGASAGVGSSGHLSLELLKNMAGLDIVHVPYQGAAPARVDLSAGRVQVVVDNIPGYMASFADGSVRLLAVGTRERLADFPDTPTVEETGLDGFQAIVWYALAAPKGAPQEVIDTMNRATNEIMNRPDIQKRLKDLHAIPMGGTPAEAVQFIKDETTRWKKVIEAAGVEPK